MESARDPAETRPAASELGTSTRRRSLDGTERLRLEATIDRLQTALVHTQSALSAVQAERDALLNSTSWRLAQRLGRIAGLLPPAARRLLRRNAAPADDQPDPPVQAMPEAPLGDIYSRWLRECDRLTDEDRTAIALHIDHLPETPLFTVIVQGSQPDALRETVASMQTQLYPHWELCILSESPTLDPPELAATSRITFLQRDAMLSARSVLDAVGGSFAAIIHAGDRLSERALYEIAVELSTHPEADLVYADEDRIDASGQRHSPYFKPNWNIDLMLGQNFLGQFVMYRRALMARIAGEENGFPAERSDYGRALRAVAATEASHIRHIPAILYHCRTKEAPARSLSEIAFARTTTADRAACTQYLEEQGIRGAKVVPAPTMPAWNRVHWPLPDPAPSVSLIVPTRDKPELLACCAAALLHRTDYPNIEFIIVDNDSSDPEALALLGRLQVDPRVRVLPFHGAFNYSAINNTAVRTAKGDIVVLLNNDIDVIESHWLREMVSLARRPDVGAVGAKLLFGSGHIQHAGVMLGVGVSPGGQNGVAGHFGLSVESDALGHFGQFVLTRELSAVTGACLALRRAVYQAVGGLDEEHLPVSFNDVDLCLRIREQGLHILWTPFAELYHLESSSRGLDDSPETVARAAREALYMRERWGPVLDNDPFYNINFDRLDPMRPLAIPSRRAKPWARFL